MDNSNASKASKKDNKTNYNKTNNNKTNYKPEARRRSVNDATLKGKCLNYVCRDRPEQL